jgi:hypothetical protein
MSESPSRFGQPASSRKSEAGLDAAGHSALRKFKSEIRNSKQIQTGKIRKAQNSQREVFEIVLSDFGFRASDLDHKLLWVATCFLCGDHPGRQSCQVQP